MPSSVQRVDAERLAQRLHVGDDVVGAEELPPRAQLAREHARTAAAVGGQRSELPISDCSAAQSSAPAPVPRWS